MARKDMELRPLMARIPEGLRRKLEREAERNNRSLNAELIHRLGESFAKEDRFDELLKAAFGDDRNVALFRRFAAAIAEAEQRMGKKWHDDPATREKVEQSLRFEMFRTAEPEAYSRMLGEMLLKTSNPPDSAVGQSTQKLIDEEEKP